MEMPDPLPREPHFWRCSGGGGGLITMSVLVAREERWGLEMPLLEVLAWKSV